MTKRLSAFIGLLLLALAWLTACQSSETPAQTQKAEAVKMASPVIINGYDYADLRATSYLPYTPGQAAMVAWPKDSIISADGRQPIGLTIVDDKLLVRYSNYLEMRKKGNAEKLWGTEVHFGCDIQVTPDGVLSRDFAGFYQTIGFDSKVSEGLHIPFLNEKTHLQWVLRSGNEVRFAFASAPVPVHGTHGTPIDPTGNYGRLTPDSDMAVWFFQRPGSVSRGARTSADGSNVCLGTYNYLDIFPADAADDKQVTMLPVTSLHSLSVDHSDHILVVDDFEEKMRLRRLDFAGKEEWALELKSQGKMSQPVASAPGDRFWLAVGNKIYQYVGRNLIWEHTVLADGQVFMTACADNSLLVVCDSLFTRLSEHGQPIINRVFSGKFTCRPVVDETGRIYLGGTQGLICLQ